MSVVDAALEDAAASLGLEGGAIAPSELAAVGVTQGPGLVGALVVGVAFAKERGDDLPQQLTEVFQEMLADGTVRQIVSRYLDDPEHYLDGLEDSTHA